MKIVIASMAGSLMLAASASTAIAQPEFTPYEARTPQIHEGQGGERKTVDGVDFWLRGDPPHRYQFLGSLTDERHKTGLWGLIRMASFESDIAKACKAAGGDAVILDSMHDEVTGVVSDGFASGSGTYSGTGNTGSANASWFGSGLSRPVKEQDARFLVVKYLPDAAPAGTPPAGATAPAPAAPPAPTQ